MQYIELVFYSLVMLFYARSPLEGLALELCVSPFWPPIPARSPDGYRAHLRELWRRSPELFMHLARTARTLEVTLLSTGRPELLEAWYESIVAVARRQGWEIDGGLRGSAPMRVNVSGRYVPE